MKPKPNSQTRNLVLVLGDQLNPDSAAFDGFDPAQDAVWMAEVAEESTHVWSHQARIVLFLAAMRHFRDDLRTRGVTVHYRELDAPDNTGTLHEELLAALRELSPQRLILVEPGDWRVREQLRGAAHGVELRPDRHFLCSSADFATHVQNRKQLRLEFFYREMRRKTGILMTGNEPRGGQWNFDADNRAAFGQAGPGNVPLPTAFPPDARTREVMTLVRTRFANHPGRLEHFDWPLTPAQARITLDDFIAQRLPHFGRYQDAMWLPSGNQPSRPFLYHSRLAAAMNLKLLDPRVVIAAAEYAYREGAVPLASAEGFIRQILGWREYVHGLYWHFMPGYAESNALEATAALPAFYWTGDTEMNCLGTTIRQTLEHGYAHHIQRLMITGLFSLLLGVKPQAIHEWYLAVYVDAVEWVELPNTIGMSQHADGGLMASKPYVASGKYIQRMSNYCTGCRFDPAKATGENACPFTTLYWDFLMRHQPYLARNQRMGMQLKNLNRLTERTRAAILKQAEMVKASCA